MVPNTSAAWYRGTLLADGRVGAPWTTVKGFTPVAFYPKPMETISGGIRTRIADARMIVTSSAIEEVKAGDRFTVRLTGSLARYRVTVATPSPCATGFYWTVYLLEAKDDPT